MSQFSEMVLNYSGKYQKKLKKLSEPLLQAFGINYFYYIYISNDNKTSFLGTNPELVEDYFDRGMQRYNPFYKHAQSLTDGICLYDAVVHERFQQSMSYLETKYDTKHVCILSKREQEGVGIYGFSVSRQNRECQNIVINQFPLLRQFSDYFEDEMDHILEDMQAHSVEFTFDSDIAKPPQILLDKEKVIEFLRRISAIDTKLLITEFTQREIECIKLLLSGKTAAEIAKSLHLSSRTIEHRLQALKDKLGCRTKSELIQRLQKMKELYSSTPNQKL